MAVRTNAARKGSMSILMDDLTGNVQFDIKQTLPMMDLKSEKYDKGMSLYLTRFLYSEYPSSSFSSSFSSFLILAAIKKG